MPLYCFHQCIIDTTRHCLTVRGQLLATPPLIFDLLHFFASHPNRVLSKDELLESVWKTTFVTDSVVARAVMKARRLISGDHSSEGLITTIRGVGYRFDAEVSLVEDASVSQPGDRSRDAAPTVAETFSAPPSRALRPALAVLPFVNEDADPQLMWAERGLAGLVHHQLETKGRISVASINATGDWHGVAAWGGEALSQACQQLGTERALLCQFGRSPSGDFRMETLLGSTEADLESRVFQGGDLVALASAVVSYVDALAAPVRDLAPVFWEEQLARAFDCELRGELGAALPLLESCMQQLHVTPRMRLVHARLLREQSADMERARQTALDALRGAQLEQQCDLQVDIYAELCRTEVNSGDLGAAHLYCERGMDMVFAGEASAAVLANILIARADLERFQGKAELAAKTAARAVEAAKAVGDVYREKLAACLHGHVLMAVPRLPKAIELLRSVVRETRLRGLTRVELQAYQSLGTALGMVRQFSAAVEATRRAALLSNALGFKGKFIGSRIQETFVLVDAGRLVEAEANVRECQNLMGAEAPIYLSSALARVEAHMKWRQGHREAALQQMEEMLALARQWGWYTRWLCAALLCGWYLVLDRHAEAQQVVQVLEDDTNAARRARCEAALLLHQGRAEDALARLRSAWTMEPSDGAAGQDLAIDFGWILLEQGKVKELEFLMKSVSCMSSEHLPTALLQTAYEWRRAFKEEAPEPWMQSWQERVKQLPSLQRNAVAWAGLNGLQRLLAGQIPPSKRLLTHACD